jgi:hypothetical protein
LLNKLRYTEDLRSHKHDHGYITEIFWNAFFIGFIKPGRLVIAKSYLGNLPRLPNISEQAKNGLFDIFTESSAFGVREHNALLDALADPNKGWNLQDY